MRSLRWALGGLAVCAGSFPHDCARFKEELYYQTCPPCPSGAPTGFFGETSLTCVEAKDVFYDECSGVCADPSVPRNMYNLVQLRDTSGDRNHWAIRYDDPKSPSTTTFLGGTFVKTTSDPIDTTVHHFYWVDNPLGKFVVRWDDDNGPNAVQHGYIYYDYTRNALVVYTRGPIIFYTQWSLYTECVAEITGNKLYVTKSYTYTLDTTGAELLDGGGNTYLIGNPREEYVRIAVSSPNTGDVPSREFCSTNAENFDFAICVDHFYIYGGLGKLSDIDFTNTYEYNFRNFSFPWESVKETELKGRDVCAYTCDAFDCNSLSDTYAESYCNIIATSVSYCYSYASTQTTRGGYHRICARTCCQIAQAQS